MCSVFVTVSLTPVTCALLVLPCYVRFRVTVNATVIRVRVVVVLIIPQLFYVVIDCADWTRIQWFVVHYQRGMDGLRHAEFFGNLKCFFESASSWRVSEEEIEVFVRLVYSVEQNLFL